MKSLTFSPAAEADLEKIWDYSAENWGPDQADRYTDEIRDACQMAASGEKRGRLVDVRPGYLKISSGSHMDYFHEEGDRLEIIRILHGKQDVEWHL
jgi:toxin ParE1/3/4